MTDDAAYTLNLGAEVRFIEVITDARRVCCCICPVNHGSTTGICALFIERGETVILERYGGDHFAARCLPCARAGGYRPPRSPATTQQPVVRLGSRVRIRYDQGQSRTVLIRTGEPQAWAVDSLSADSPLGTALMGHHAGEEVEVVLHPSIPSRRVKIEAIE
jgi:hypothetical protein